MKSGFVRNHGKEKCIELIKEASKNRVFLSQFAKDNHTTAQTIKRFIELHMKGFEYKALSRAPINYAWLVNASIKDTVAFLEVEYFQKNRTFSEMVKELGATKNQLQHFMDKHVESRKQTREFKQNAEYYEELEENRYFSIHIVGTKPEALDRLKEVA